MLDRPAESTSPLESPLSPTHVVATPPPARGGGSHAWEKPVLSARGFKCVGRRSEHAIYNVNGMEVRKKRPRGFKKRPRGFK
jgi:hypothetical protein